MDQENRAGALQPPRRLLEAEQALHQERDETALAVEEEKRQDADQRRQHRGQRDQSAEHPAAGKVVSPEEQRERNADQSRKHHADQRDPETAPERAPLGGPVEEEPDEVEGPAPGAVDPLDQHQQQRVDHEPEQQDEDHGSDDPAAAIRRHVCPSGKRWMPPPSRRLGMMPTRAPGSTACAGAATSSSAPWSVAAA